MDWAYSGVNTTVPRNAGPECADYLDPTWRWMESVVVLAGCFATFWWSFRKISLPRAADYVRTDRGGRRALLVLMSLIWGMEIGYKFSSRTVIYLLNPCHVTTALQIYLLAASPNKMVTAVFRFHLNLLNGPLLAFIFPETDSRILPLEAAIYWVQHGMMFVVPYYLLRLGGVYNVEEFSDISWNALSYSINIIYHYAILQTIAIPTQVNLNHMICPAILDPFGGPYYRIAAVVHQAILCPLMCKLFCSVSAFFLTKFWPTKVKRTLCCEVAAPNSNGDMTDSNGRRQHSD
ncbi:PREDICTED: transmembrane protein 164 [Nicrophorus vespilloides]|uniref:Transmembrane protein 164 n=1 Tax=Nicrophorus vespilloides TaxID=110193 RepID=A0ABM1MVC7_NICVS|nr:PREDICTED: transmembrane protein 164 [Nicrophorus vespilloides]XP_017778528.1 PREDICTED: transmembrane protein 164 [Nicrophorus vespilloides]XP_017778529.1 PREDICTED: transmembrane protein 164 [Nicrophorus vespilloides]XP_017778530.1 PREDICTED: transmembrane protein 164 [Nicrophorus vespilloides]